MALSNSSKNYGIVTSSPNRNFRVFNHDTGSAQSGKQLLVLITMQRTVQFTGASYDGVSMPNSTLVLYQDFSGLSQRQIVYTLANPSDGNNEFRVNFSGNQWGGVSIACYTFIGCGGVGNTGQNGGSGTPNSKTLTCSNGSIIMMAGISNNAFQNFVIDGVFTSPESTSISLLEGWNMVGYLRTTGSPADLVLADLVDDEVIIIAKDYNGSAYLPEYSFNGIGDMFPGQGYQIKTNQSGTLQYLSDGESY